MTGHTSYVSPLEPEAGKPFLDRRHLVGEVTTDDRVLARALHLAP